MARSTPSPGRRARRATLRRRVTLLVVVVALAAVAWVTLLDRGSSYTIHARFANAGQLVEGGRVEVGGVSIGEISKITLADDGQADVAMRITDDRFNPLRSGTRASIRAVGQATITNRFIALAPGPSDAPELADGAVLTTAVTAGIVDLDAVLSSIDPTFRKRLSVLIERGADAYAGSSAPAFNKMLGQLSPATRAVDGLASDVASDQDEINKLIRTGASAAKAVANRRTDLEQALQVSATAFGAVADERASLASGLQRAPAVLRQAGGTLNDAADTTRELRPTLRAVPAPQAQLRLLLRRLPKALQRTAPVARKVDAIVPNLQRTLRGLPGLETPVVQGTKDLQAGLDKAMPMLEGIRFYGSDLILGVVNGLVSVATGPYNEAGHYIKIEFVQNPQTILGGALAPLLGSLTKLTNGVVPNVINVDTNKVARCPGGNAPPAPDGSNPWYPKKGLCDPTQSLSKLVNSPTATCTTASTCEGDDRNLKPDSEEKGIVGDDRKLPPLRDRGIDGDDSKDSK